MVEQTDKSSQDTKVSGILSFWMSLQNNSKSVRVVLTSASIFFLLSVFLGQLSSPEPHWTVDGVHWATEHFIFDILIGIVVCLLVQSMCWMDTIRPFNKDDEKKKDQLKSKSSS